MKRKIYEKLLKWKNQSDGKSAVLIEGARRIGKSYIAEEFARNEYDTYLIVDFSKAPKEVFDLFENWLMDIDTLLNRLQLIYGVSLPNNRSAIILDEVQFCPRARQAIKFLVENGRYHYIETGSLISIKRNVKDILIPSEERKIEMFPMDFEEFMWAKGETLLMDFIADCFASKKPLEQLHRKSTDLFRQYMAVGGMPQVVRAYIERQDFDEIEEIKRQIITLYRNDINKYANGGATKVKAIFDEIPGQLQRHERKFRLSEISENARQRDYADAFFWLMDAGMINCCYNSTAPNIGLRLNEDRTTLKCYMGDTGLLISMAYDEHGEDTKAIYRKLITGTLSANEGMILENVVAQELRSAGHKLYFYSKYDEIAENRMEIDFLISKPTITSRHNISPIEVKSGNRYALSSLNKCIRKFGEYLSTPYVIHDKDFRVENGITFIPWYMVGLL